MAEKYVITSPEPEVGDGSVRELFLAGGITDCPNWQKEAVEKIETEQDIIIYNPRREYFDTSDPTATDKQIEWEYKRLERSDGILFWFPCETLCPIVLLEYGEWGLATSKQLFVGVHPEYKRKKDVFEQTKHARPCLKIYEDIDSTIREFNSEFARKDTMDTDMTNMFYQHWHNSLIKDFCGRDIPKDYPWDIGFETHSSGRKDKQYWVD